MIFRQFLHERIAAASYLIGCSTSGEAAVVDPSLPAEHYALFAADKGLRITHILETHLHADYISTARALAALTGARIAIPRTGEVRFDHDPLDDGASITLGTIVITALHTPGHTPEHTTYLVADTPRASDPWFVLTGDCLFVGDVGRADLLDLPLTGPEYLYKSIFGKLLRLPDTTEIYPAHYGDAVGGGKQMSGKASSTIGFERRFNWALQAPDRATFAAWISTTPRAVAEDVLLHRHTNQGILPLPPGYGHVRRDDSPMVPVAVVGLSVREAAASGATLIDLRPASVFAAAHPQGALNAPYSRDALPQRIEALTTPGEPLALISDQPFVARNAAELLAQARRNPVRGYIDADIAAWQAAGLATDTLRTLSVDETRHLIESGAALVLDVRDPLDHAQEGIPGARLMLWCDVQAARATLPRDQYLLVVGESGTRAVMAASLLRAQGFARVAALAPEGRNEYLERYP